MERPHGAKRHPQGKVWGSHRILSQPIVRLRQFLTTARLDLDNNIIERSIRPIAIGRKNWMFAGSEEGARRAALLMSLVGTCKLLGIDPAEYLRDVLLRAKTCKPTAEGCADLTPNRWNWGGQSRKGHPKAGRGDYRGLTRQALSGDDRTNLKPGAGQAFGLTVPPCGSVERCKYRSIGLCSGFLIAAHLVFAWSAANR